MSSNTTNLNFEEIIGAATRSVSEAFIKQGKPVRTITLERSYATSTDDLWDAVTNPVRLARFFSPVSGELKLGGRYQIEGNAEGTITDCVPPTNFAATWELGGELSWIEIRIDSEAHDRSRLSLSHICPVDEHWETYGPGAGGVGWDLTLLGLYAHLTITGFDQEDGIALMVSEEGRSFMVQASELWGQAAIAAGTPQAAAVTAMNRTTAFYLSEESQA
ncbi:SRPBCC domain-containing protein [Paenibacillus sp. 1P07SE]|uniref:SRPBCC domain-containing protein n=1 Tax=Paenibacillus sp. 1P07SE TaxID=3132209 RepID=UPI0039A76C31